MDLEHFVSLLRRKIWLGPDADKGEAERLLEEAVGTMRAEVEKKLAHDGANADLFFEIFLDRDVRTGKRRKGAVCAVSNRRDCIEVFSRRNRVIDWKNTNGFGTLRDYLWLLGNPQPEPPESTHVLNRDLVSLGVALSKAAAALKMADLELYMEMCQ